MKIVNIKERPEFLEEIVKLTMKEWGSEITQDKITRKISQIKSLWNRNDYCKLILIENDILIGFISIFPTDGDVRTDLTPWYATMYVKSEYRGLGYSKILNDAILKEAKKREFQKIYLKTELNNYYEKYGAHYIENLDEKEKLYYFDLTQLCD